MLFLSAKRAELSSGYGCLKLTTSLVKLDSNVKTIPFFSKQSKKKVRSYCTAKAFDFCPQNILPFWSMYLYIEFMSTVRL